MEATGLVRLEKKHGKELRRKTRRAVKQKLVTYVTSIRNNKGYTWKPTNVAS